jgi:hypothetical protein
MELLAGGQRIGYLLKTPRVQRRHRPSPVGYRGTVEKHVHSILSKLRLPETADDHRRVLAVITFLETH